MPKSKIAIVWRGDRETRSTATPENTRLKAIFAALAAEGFAPEPAVFAEEFADEVRAQLAAAPDSQAIATVLSGMSQSALTANGIAAGETVGQWRASVSAKIGNAAGQSVLST